MGKNTKKSQKIKLYSRFVRVFLEKTLKRVSKNILFQIFRSGVFGRKKTIYLEEKKNTNRIFSYLKNIQKNAFLGEGIPIFSHISYQKGKLTYEFSSESVAYFEWAEKSHKMRKDRKKKRAEKYILVDDREYLALKKIHAKTLYMLMLGWTDTQLLILPKEKLEVLFGIRRNKDIRKDVLGPAIEEINQKTSFNVAKWKLSRYSNLKIEFSPFVKKQEKVSKEKQEINIKDRKKYIAVKFLCQKFGQSIPFASKAYDELGWDCLDSIVRAILHKKRMGNIYDLEGYVYTVLKKKIESQMTANSILAKKVA